MTNYDATRELLERYEDGPKSGPSSRPQPQHLPVTPQRAVPAVPQNTPVNIRTPISPGLESQLARTYPKLSLFILRSLSGRLLWAEPSQRPLPPPRKLWYDKLADALLGDDEPVNAPASRYALICQKCFTHNGLVKEEMWEDARTHAFSVMMSDLEHDHRNGRIRLSQVWAFQSLGSLTAGQSPPVSAPVTRNAADPSTTYNTWYITKERSGSSGQRRWKPDNLVQHHNCRLVGFLVTAVSVCMTALIDIIRRLFCFSPPKHYWMPSSNGT